MKTANPTSFSLKAAKHALSNVVSDGHPDLDQRCNRLLRLFDLFSTLYGERQVSLLRAPARINILGEHIDYVSYLPTASLTFASRERDMLMLYAPLDSPLPREVRGASTDPVFTNGSVSLHDAIVPSLVNNTQHEWLTYLSKHRPPEPHWLNYVKGAIDFAVGKFGERVQNGFDFAIDSNIPAGGGASSSSALTVLGGAALRSVNHISFSQEELANDSAMAEWFIGTRGGSMDHKTICLAEPNHALLISYAAGNIDRLRLPDEPFQWITFFSKPADKGREVMTHYNERAAVSRLVIPAIIDQELATNSGNSANSQRKAKWVRAVASFASGSVEMIDAAESVINELPATIRIDQLERCYPETFIELRRSFPALLEDKARWPLQVRARALHHLGEVNRVAIAVQRLNSLGNNSTTHNELSTMEVIGQLLNESHDSLRALYEVSTDEVENLISIIRSDRQVLGARIIGGGFGGNVLALTTRDAAKDVIERVETEYYGPQNRNGVDEGSIMVSTPGPGLSHIELNNLWRESLSHINSLGSSAATYSSNICSILDSLPNKDFANIWPVLVAAGKGTRALASGLETPKPVATVLNQPAIVHVLRNIQSALGKTKPPIIIVSPETEKPVRDALVGEDVLFVLQPVALGTGDAVLHAQEQLANFDGRTLVVWSTQPVIQPNTFARTARLATLFTAAQIALPTTFKQRPYAPTARSENGAVTLALETHLKGAGPVDYGETNIGLFVVDNRAMFDVLLDLKKRYWNEGTSRYNRPSGELGFPNEVINTFAKHESGVIASPFANPLEEQGIKSVEDLKRCETFIKELQKVTDPSVS